MSKKYTNVTAALKTVTHDTHILTADKIIVDKIVKPDGSSFGGGGGDIVESYNNGTSWYILYSNGMCDMGGKYIWDGTSTTPKEATITLYKEMVDTNYTVHVTSSNYTAAGYFPWVNNITTTSFVLYMSGTAGTRSDVFWRVMGKVK